MEITTSWEIKGQSNTILRLLNRKFGTLPDSIANQVKALEPSQLDNLTEDLLDFQTRDDLTDWLNNH